MGEGRGGEGDPGAADALVSGAPAPSDLDHDKLDEYVRRLFAREDDGLLVADNALRSWIARALPSDGKLITLEIDPDRAAVARDSVADASLADQVEVRVGDALDQMVATDPEPPFDAVFLDADKERYCDYLEQAARLVRHNGLLVADNALWRGEVLDPEGFGGLAVDIHRFNERVAADPRFEATILPVGDGLMVAARVAG